MQEQCDLAGYTILNTAYQILLEIPSSVVRAIIRGDLPEISHEASRCPDPAEPEICSSPPPPHASHRTPLTALLSPPSISPPPHPSLQPLLMKPVTGTVCTHIPFCCLQNLFYLTFVGPDSVATMRWYDIPLDYVHVIYRR